jgi:hypothetical protein
VRFFESERMDYDWFVMKSDTAVSSEKKREARASPHKNTLKMWFPKLFHRRNFKPLSPQRIPP